MTRSGFRVHPGTALATMFALPILVALLAAAPSQASPGATQISSPSSRQCSGCSATTLAAAQVNLRQSPL